MFIKINTEEVNIKNLFLIYIVDYKTKTEIPFFVTDNQMFAINYFESWKIENNEIEKLCKIIKLPLITQNNKE